MRTALIAIALPLVLLAGCSSKAKQEKAFADRIQADRTRVEALAAKVESVTGPARERLNRQVHKLRVWLSAIDEFLTQLKSASTAEVRQTLSDSLKKALDKLDKAIAAAETNAANPAATPTSGPDPFAGDWSG
ncbi:MAG: hypothetical protein BIFFINMI_03372 [Phycisphaerae bacterium]|nr:hypothetical protein [Phycisphaerae bacterium]